MIDRLKAFPIILAIALVNTVFRFIRVESAWKIGECLGTLCYRIMPSRRAIIDYNMEVVSNATQDFNPNAPLTESIFQRNCANLACSLKTYGMTPQQLTDCVDISISPEFRQAIQSNSGAILCLAHMGNWEILSKISSLVDPEPEKFGAVYRPLDNKAADDYVAQQRQEYNCQMFSKSTPMGTLSTFIREGGILGILADQRSGGMKNARPFFGVDSERSKLPAVLHLRTGAPLFSVAVSSPEPAKWRVEIIPIPTDVSDINVDDAVTLITSSYEKNFRSNLLDVFWLHRYWVKKA
ncbi:lysophospholipid acyltransferase family protein [Rubritalea tangerina]|uniref:Lysophospholipid acyltransferase family protein n=1 Tax=Rubritalea tangerina TaxID=430798 RepID=A0ABW4ZCD9_9BACT